MKLLQEATYIHQLGKENFFLIATYLFLLLIFCIFKNKKISLEFFANFFYYLKKNKICIIILFILSLLITSHFYKYFSAENYNYTYRPTGPGLKYDFIFYFIIFFLNIFLTFLVVQFATKNNFIAFFTALFFCTSPIHVYFLFPSLFKDYIKLTFYLAFILMLLVFYFDNIDKQERRKFFIVLISIIYSTAIFFRPDINVILPSLILTIFLKNIQINQKINLLINFLFFSLPAIFLYKFNNLGYLGIDSIITSFGSNDISNTYQIDFLYDLGPFNDHNADLLSCTLENCNSLIVFLKSFFQNINFYLEKLYFIYLEILNLPFSNTLFFKYDDSLLTKLLNLKGIFLFSLRRIFEYSNYFLIFIFIICLVDIKKWKFKTFILYFLLILNLFSYPILQSYIKHFFFLEIFPFLIVSFIMYKIIFFLFKYFVK